MTRVNRQISSMYMPVNLMWHMILLSPSTVYLAVKKNLQIHRDSDLLIPQSSPVRNLLLAYKIFELAQFNH